jgi:hypothetical protein
MANIICEVAVLEFPPENFYGPAAERILPKAFIPIWRLLAKRRQLL